MLGGGIDHAEPPLILKVQINRALCCRRQMWGGTAHCFGQQESARHNSFRRFAVADGTALGIYDKNVSGIDLTADPVC